MYLCAGAHMEPGRSCDDAECCWRHAIHSLPTVETQSPDHTEGAYMLPLPVALAIVPPEKSSCAIRMHMNDNVLICALQGHGSTIEDVVFKPGSKEQLASVGDDQCLLLWDTRSGNAPANRVAQVWLLAVVWLSTVLSLDKLGEISE